MNEILKPSYLEELPSEGYEDKVLLCSHGLNQNPEALKFLLSDIGRMGFKTHLLHLPGHNGEKNYSKLKVQDFFEAHKKSYDYLVQRHKAPIFFLGYSFGGLIGVHQFDACPFDKMVLLAPALKLHGYTSLIKPFLPVLKRVVSVQLGHPEYEKKYRYHSKGVPSKIYSCFFNIYGQYKIKDKSLVKKSSALVMIHPRDELVSFRKLKRWVKKKTNWKFVRLDNKKAEFRRYKHLCFDPTTLGQDSYNQLVKEIRKFL